MQVGFYATPKCDIINQTYEKKKIYIPSESEIEDFVNINYEIFDIFLFNFILFNFFIFIFIYFHLYIN